MISFGQISDSSNIGPTQNSNIWLHQHVMVAASRYTRNAVKYEANSKRIKATNVLDV